MRWVTANHLEQWADSIASRTDLSELVSDLIRASAPAIDDFRFPVGDSAQIRGFDGYLIAAGALPYVPDGESVWEFGVDLDYVSKANADYASRTDNPVSVSRENTTFVFVTPRKWNRPKATLDNWLSDRRAEGVWKDVRAIDGVALEEWLSTQPAVAANFARKLGLMPRLGVQSTDDFWEEYATRFDPVLTEAVLLAGRENQAQELVQQLRDQPYRHIWQADSPEEVIAFAVAAIRVSESGLRHFLESRTLVVSDEDAARQLAARQNLIFLPRAAALRIDSLLGQRNATIIPIGRDGPFRQGASLLNRPTGDQLVEALKTMRLSERRALQIGRNCGRSVTVLARLIPSGSSQKPGWADQSDLIPALLAGGWDTRSKEDQQVVAALAGKRAYAEYEDELRTYLRTQDPPIEREGDVWAVRAPVDAFLHLAPLVGQNHLDRLRDAFLAVFSERDPMLDVPADDRPYAGLRGKRLKHSEWLRRGLATTALLVSALHEQAALRVSGIDPGQFIDDLVGALPNLDTNYQVIASLHGELSLLMEASPRPLLRALGRLLEGDGGAMRPIFQDREESLFGSYTPHTGLLWALEILAWDPSYVSDACLMLARLSRVDPGGRLSNRPLNSLREILLPWLPNTYANLEQRLTVLDRIIKEEPAIGWQLTVKLLPEYQGVGSYNPKPRYRDAGASGAEIVTVGIVRRTYQEVIHRAIEMLGFDPDRWTTIIRNLSSFSPDDRSRVIALLGSNADRFQDPGRTTIWDALRSEVNRHRAFQTADWAMQQPDLERLKAVADVLQPVDLVAQIAWLFDQYHPNLPEEDGTSTIEAIESERQRSVGDLITTTGDSSVIRLAKRVKFPNLLAGPVVAVVNDPDRVASLVDWSLRTDGLEEFASSLSVHARVQLGEAWGGIITEKMRVGSWATSDIVQLLLNWPDERRTWEFLSSIDAGIEGPYWARKRVWLVRGSSEDLNFAARRLLEAGRPLAAITAMHHSADSLTAETVFDLLDQAVEELNRAPDHANASLTYELDDLFASLRKRETAPAIEIARREYKYLPLYGYRQKRLTLHELLAKDAALFVSVLCDVFKPESGEDRPATDQSVARAQAGYRLLSDFNTVPGLTESGIDANALNTWISEVQRLAAVEGRETIANEYIGRVLAHSPHSPDGAWPIAEVAEIIEHRSSDSIERGIAVERFNMRGVTTRGPFDGGEQERALAERIGQWANLRTTYPRTYALLSQMAAAWRREGEREDERAKLDAMRFQ